MTEKKQKTARKLYKSAFLHANLGNPPTVDDIAKYTGNGTRAVRDWFNKNQKLVKKISGKRPQKWIWIGN